ncbi:DUF4198 domain-containing protein [Reichenbachiella ulvae]|uniref:DUF4198 domain-containing protein n=1 Tax=Reichenbachiella ulvae TaxID=2980104 RepID=A0ABT3CR51_9BACT|nr:DUF4198 domain-containing protein [Reichenbachiella ulvae]MCV9386129.1 DUF4198 domain-containing protein [Reichenbachiella ulvae]
MKRIILSMALMIGVCQISFAHFMWIETEATGKQGVTQEIKVYFGEYNYGVYEEVGGESFDKMKDFQLWVVDPAGKKQVLTTEARDKYYLARYTPQTEGTFTVILDNDQIDVVDYSQYDFGIFKTHYHAMAEINVGGEASLTADQNESGLSIQRVPSDDDTVKLQLSFLGKPLAESEVSVFISDQWKKEIYTDKEGFVTFTLPWSTKYIVGVTKKEEVPGQFRGEDYEFVWNCVTYCINN